MVLFWLVSIGALLLISWGTISYIAWRLSQGHTPRKLSLRPLLLLQAKFARLIRRGRYIAWFYIEKWLVALKKKFRNLFLKAVPSAQEAFGEKELPREAVPSSFLQEIIDTKEKAAPRLSKRKKML